MRRSGKLAVSLPGTLLAAVEELRKETGESRSSFFQRAVRHLIQDREHRRRVHQYVEGYRARPESKAEIAAAEASATRLLAEEPWE